MNQARVVIFLLARRIHGHKKQQQIGKETGARS
jgi:hypothetical protein